MGTQKKVVIVDDSHLVQKYLTRILESDPELCVVGCADDPFEARELIKQHHPDVITLDIEMPKMDGLTFLKNLMRLHPLPVVMCSSLTAKGSQISLAALELGAIDYILKPEITDPNEFAAYSIAVLEKVKNAAHATVQAISQSTTQHVKVRLDYDRVNVIPDNGGGSISRSNDPKLAKYVIAIGASTGGVEALSILLAAIPENYPPILITQHIPHNFALSFAERLNEQLTINVCIAKDGAQVLPGHVYIAPGDNHMAVVKKGADVFIKYDKRGPVGGHTPSVDVLFESVADVYGKHCIAALLTGMGADGAAGMLKIRNTGAYTVAQSKESCVVWGMPRRAVELGAICEQLPLQDIASEINKQLSKLVNRD